MVREIWEIEISHEGLNKYRHIRGTDKYVVERKAAEQQRTWEEMWEKKQVAEQKRREREQAANEKDKKKQLALEKTKEAQELLTDIENILHHTIDIDDTIDWQSLIDNSEYPVEKPATPEKIPLPPPPDIGFFKSLIPGNKKRKLEEWEEEKEKVREKAKDLEIEHKKAIQKWEKDKEIYLRKQASSNKKIQEQENAYFRKDPNAIEDYCEMVLSNSVYPETFPQDWDLEYNSNNKILIVDYLLPNHEQVPGS